MPTYEFRCPAGHTFDRVMKMSESVAELPCPHCGDVALRQMSGGAGLVFKGSGFYLTDYGRNAHRTSGPKSPEGASSGESRAPASSESGDSASRGSPSGGGGGDSTGGGSGRGGSSSGGSSSGGSGRGGSGGDSAGSSSSGTGGSRSSGAPGSGSSSKPSSEK